MVQKPSVTLRPELNRTLLQARLAGTMHQSYQSEMEFFDLVKNGEVEILEARHFRLIVEGQGSLSSDPLVNMRCHAIIAAALIARGCVDNGLDREEAYTISDVYIRRVNEIEDMAELEALHNDMVFTYARKMQALRKKRASSVYVRRALDYITLHLNSHLLVEDIAAFAGISAKYLSALFKKEIEMTIADYIEHRRMEEASAMLLYSDFSYAEIADTLSYSSQSYFSKIFKRHFGLTPMQYRKNNCR